MDHADAALSSDAGVLSEVGQRMAQQRIARGLSQAELAREAGVSKRTVERLEQGHSAQLTNFVRVLRALGLLGALMAALPAPGPTPMQRLQADTRGTARKRVRKPRSEPKADEPFVWGDES